MARILLTDGQQRKTLAAARSLGRRGHEVWVGEETWFATSAFSRHCRGRLVYPRPSEDPSAFVTCVTQFVDKYSIDVVVPMDDAAVLALAPAPSRSGLRAALAAPTQACLEILSDKVNTVVAAVRVGITAPTTVPLDHDESYARAARVIGFPMVVRPRRASGGRGFGIVGSSPELEALHAQASGRHGTLMAQSVAAAGDKYDVCVLMGDAGEPVATFVQKELRHFPMGFGTSTVQESVLMPDLVELTTSLLREIGWTGVAEAEFMLDPLTGQYVLMEVNPRFWASLQLAVSCGVDFPALLVDVLLGQSPAPISTYTVGKRCRWLLPGDIMHFASNPDRRSMSPAFFDWRGAEDDIIRADDLGPVLGFALGCLRYAFDIDMWRLILRR